MTVRTAIEPSGFNLNWLKKKNWSLTGNLNGGLLVYKQNLDQVKL